MVWKGKVLKYSQCFEGFFFATPAVPVCLENRKGNILYSIKMETKTEERISNQEFFNGLFFFICFGFVNSFFQIRYFRSLSLEKNTIGDFRLVFVLALALKRFKSSSVVISFVTFKHDTNSLPLPNPISSYLFVCREWLCVCMCGYECVRKEQRNQKKEISFDSILHHIIRITNGQIHA